MAEGAVSAVAGDLVVRLYSEPMNRSLRKRVATEPTALARSWTRKPPSQRRRSQPCEKSPGCPRLLRRGRQRPKDWPLVRGREVQDESPAALFVLLDRFLEIECSQVHRLSLFGNRYEEKSACGYSPIGDGHSRPVCKIDHHVWFFHRRGRFLGRPSGLRLFEDKDRILVVGERLQGCRRRR